MTTHRARGPRTSRIDRRWNELRERLDRVEPASLVRCLAQGALLVDIRPVEQRELDGELPGALTIDRNVLEWRLDPSSAHCIPEATEGKRVVIVCNEGYSSTLAAVSLQAIGLDDATDVIDGFQGLLRADVPRALHMWLNDLG